MNCSDRRQDARGIRLLPLMVIALAALPLKATAAGDSPASANSTASANGLVYRTDQGVTFQVTADGLSLSQVGKRELARGGWSVFNAEPWFKDSGSGRVNTSQWHEKSIAILGPQQARVRHVKGSVTCVTDYTFAGEDLLISARVENNHPEEPVNVVGFSGLEFKFDRPPTGLMMVQHISYFQAHGVGLCHPGHWSRIGGSYAVDGSIGVGLSPWKTGWNRTLLLWDYADWNPDKRENLPQRRLSPFDLPEESVFDGQLVGGKDMSTTGPIEAGLRAMVQDALAGVEADALLDQVKSYDRIAAGNGRR